MSARIDLTGQTFGRLTVHREAARGTSRGRVWECQCACGVMCAIVAAKLRNGHVRSCGCLRIEMTSARFTTHGAATARGRSATYRSWAAMIMRCENPARWQFKYYGGRGITVCARWRADFAAFLADMGERPEGCTLDRVDNDGNYEPGNCRWATLAEQARNSRRARIVEHAGEQLSVAAWGERTGIPATLIASRLRRGWSAARALSPNDLAHKA